MPSELRGQLGSKEFSADMARRKAAEDAAAEYWRILSRHKRPRAGDADRLLELLGPTGRGREDLGSDISLLEKIDQGNQAAKRLPSLTKQGNDAQFLFDTAKNALPEKIEALKQEIKELERVAETALKKWSDCRADARAVGHYAEQLRKRGMPSALIPKIPARSSGARP